MPSEAHDMFLTAHDDHVAQRNGLCHQSIFARCLASVHQRTGSSVQSTTRGSHFDHEIIPTSTCADERTDTADLQDITVWSAKGIGFRVMPGHRRENAGDRDS